MQTCPSCGFNQNKDRARFCANCAGALTSAPVFALGVTGLLPPNAILQTRYIITRKLGQGGMGAVYQAQDARLHGKLWAIKEMSNTQLTDPVERANVVMAFQREAQLLAMLDHTNLPKVVDFFEEGSRQYLVMDFVEGYTLEQIVAATPGFLSEPTVLEWAEQLCDVLEYLHTHQPPIIFRDLKPANIMLTREGKIKLIDFGIARFFKAGKTKDTAAYGTMGYAAPEQFGTGQTDARSDIYSLGVTLHFLLTKFDPSLSPFNLPPVRNVNPQASQNTEALIARATKTGVAERFQAVTELRQQLHEMANLPNSHFSQSSSHLIGEWKGKYDGKPIRMTFGENGYVLISIGNLSHRGVYTVDLSSKLARLDIRMENGDRVTTILEFVDANTLRFENNAPSRPRPTMFSSRAILFSRQ